MFLHDALHPQLLQRVGHVIERILVRQSTESLKEMVKSYRSLLTGQDGVRLDLSVRYLIDEGHGEDQQFCIGSVLLRQNIHEIGPGFRTCSTKA